MSESDYGVDIHQVNVGQGDSAIYILFKGVDPDKAKREIKSMVLVDGGEGHSNQLKNLIKTIQILGDEYKKEIRFDTIVVTHWDTDHVEGVIKLIMDDLVLGQKETPKRNQCKYLKYATDGAPKTTIYFPYWLAKDSLTPPKAKEKLKGAEKHTNKFEIQKDGMIETMTWFVPPKAKNVDSVTIEKVNLVKHTPATMLGVDFFLNNSPITGPSSINNLEKLLSTETGADKAMPGFFCISTDRKLLGTTILGSFQPTITKDPITIDNRASVVALVVWRTSKKVSYYAGGDIDEEHEKDIVTWAGVTKMDVVKASHHGASGSFPQEMIQEWKPDSIVFSCGNKHFHPTWEIVYWISQEQHFVNKPKPIWSTSYPYWLTTVKSSGDPVFKHEMKDDSVEGGKFRLFNSLKNDIYTEILKKLNDAIVPPAGLVTKPLDVWFYEIEDADGETQIRKRANWILRQLAGAWSALSNTLSESTFLTGQNTLNGLASPAKQVQYILIECRHNETTVAEQRGEGTPRKSDTTIVTQFTVEQPPPNTSKASDARKVSTRKRAATTPIDESDEDDIRQTEAKVVEVRFDEVHLASSTTNSGYLIYARIIDGETVEYDVAAEPEQRVFIEELTREVLELEQSFETAGENVPVAFQANDEMYNWFKNALSATQLSARGSGKEANHFDMELTFRASASYPLKFSTEAVPLQFDIEVGLPVTSPLSDKWGLLKSFPIMIFGLDSSGEDFEIRISDVYTFAGFTSKPWFDTTVKLIHPTATDTSTLYQRNAIWFMPSENYATAMRLNFRFSKMDELNDFLKTFLGNDFAITGANVTVLQRSRQNLLEKGYWNATISSEIVLDCAVTISKDNIGAKVTSILSNNEEDVELLIDFQGAELDKMISWLAELLNIPFDIINLLPTDLVGDPSLHRIALTFKGTKCTSASVTFQLLFKFGAEGAKQVVFFLTYAWPQKELTGTLYPGVRNKDAYNFLYPEYEPYRALRPSVPDETALAKGLNLAYIIPGVDPIDVPEHVLPTITSADVVLSPDMISFTGQLAFNEDGDFALPIVKFDTINLSAAYNWKTKALNLYLDIRAQLVPRDPDLLPADLFGSISYNDNIWSFEVMLSNLYLSSLYSFFDDDVKDGVMDMLETIEIDVLRLKYDYSSKGKSANFMFYGNVFLGPLRADCEYIHGLNSWSFNIGVGPSSAESSVGDIARSLMGTNTFLPNCVDTIKLATGQDTFTVTVSKETIPGEGDYLVFYGKFNLGVLGFSFVQLRKTGVGTISTKRVLKVGVSSLPDAQVPLLGALPQVFDEMVFMWVDDSVRNSTGLTRKEVDIINKTLFQTQPGEGIRFKETKQEGTQRPEDVVLQTGLHFLIALNQMGVSKVILDHRFGETRKAGNSFASDATDVSLSATGKDPAGSGETTMAPMAKKVGPLSISNIGLQFLNNTLYIVLDATFELGPFSMSLLGFGLGVDLSGGFNLQNLPSSLSVKLDGLAVGFEKPPLTVAGLFRYVDPLYQGGITVGFVPYSFLAAGFYGDMGQYKTVFVFARLTGPLITLAFAEISGICGGFGYNNTIGYPTVIQVPDYPFIKKDGLGTKPIDVLTALTGPGGWVQPKQDVNWFCVGLSVRAFGLLDVDAVVAVEFNPYVKLGIFALCQAGFPTKATGDFRFVYVGLGIAAVVDFEAGTMRVEGQLTPNSFVLSPSCHLTGGFGLFYWFGANEHAGDWVFTVGGYHPSFNRPVHYPNPPRLGISWRLDSTLSIIGESYFAITPKCCMAGGRLHASLSLGPLGAWFDAQANLLINFDPFYFQGDVRVSVGVSFTLRLWIVTIYIKVEIGAALYIRGPPFGGRVHVNFWVFGFNIDFGPDDKKPPAVDLKKFWEMCLQEGVSSSQGFSASPFRTRRKVSAASARVAADIANSQDHVLAAATGLLPTSSKDAETWDVRGSVFSFTIQSRFAIKNASVTGDAEVSDITPVYSKPMHLTSPISSSNMTIKITKQHAVGRILMEVVDRWLLTRVIKNVPDALWGQYNSSQDPVQSGNQIGGLLNPGDSIKIPLTMSITVSSPKPVLAEDKVPKFNFIHAMAVDVYSGDEDRPSFPEYEDKIGENFEPVEPVEGAEQWTKVQEAWGSDDAKTISQSVLDTWRVAYMWETGVKVTAVPPKCAVKDFLTVYMAAPLICA